MGDKIGNIIAKCEENLTVFLGGAGMDGDYNQEFVDVLTEAGICKSVYGKYNSPNIKGYFLGNTLGDAASVVDYNQVRLNHGNPIFDEKTNKWIIKNGPDPKYWITLNPEEDRINLYTNDYSLNKINVAEKPPMKSGQFNFIGYSWGAVITALSARYYALAGFEVDTLSLIGAPIEKSLLDSVKSMSNIKKVIIVDLKSQGDPIYAGMTDYEIISSVLTLKSQEALNNHSGHFYYNGSRTAESRMRKEDLISYLISEGLK